MKPRVLVVQPPTRPKDLSSAQRYGAIDYIFSDPRFQASESPGHARRYMEDALADYRPGEDYLLFLGGDYYGAVLLGWCLRDMFPGKEHQFLRWERERDPNGQRVVGSGFYVPAVLKP